MSTKTLDVPAKDNLKLTTVKTKSNDLSAKLGISPDRRDAICEIIEERMHNGSSNVADDMVAISSKVTSHNELAFANFMFGVHAAEMNANPLASLAALMQKAGMN